MKILQVNVVYNNGSTGKIVHDIHTVLKNKGIESIICYGRGKKIKKKNVYKTSSELLAKINALRSRILGLQYNGSWIATNKLIRIIKKERPNIVHIHCINGYFVNIYKLMKYLKESNIKTVLTLHAEFMHTGSCGHAYECERWKSGCGNCPQLWLATKSYWLDRTDTAWLKMKNAFQDFENLRIIAVSKWLQDRAKQSPIMKQHCFGIIHNGIDTEGIFKPIQTKQLKKIHGLKNEKIILHVTPSFTLHENDIKGGHYVVQLAERIKNKNIKILVIGSTDLTLELPENIINIGRTNNQEELAAYYSMAHLTLLTSKRETFSMVCVESLSCGTPVVGFKAGGPETIALNDFSEFVDYGDMDQLEEKVMEWLNVKTEDISKNIANKAHDIYSRIDMGLDYLEIYKELSQHR